MKHIKSFNEELTPYVYRKAANLAKQYKFFFDTFSLVVCNPFVSV